MPAFHPSVGIFWLILLACPHEKWGLYFCWIAPMPRATGPQAKLK